MKTSKLLLTGAIIFVFNSVYGDIIPDDSHYVNKCITITNLDEYPDIVLMGFISPWAEPEEFESYLISETDCLYKGYKFNDFMVYAIPASYLVGRDPETLNLALDKHAIPASESIDPGGSYYPDTDPLSSLSQSYKIMGFMDSVLVLFKWKETRTYLDGTPDSTEYYEYPGDVNAITQAFPDISGLQLITRKDGSVFGSETHLYPNPTGESFSLSMDNTYLGTVYIDIFSLNGQLSSRYSCEKISFNKNFTIPASDLSRGTYVVRLRFGNIAESIKLMVP